MMTLKSNVLRYIYLIDYSSLVCNIIYRPWSKIFLVNYDDENNYKNITKIMLT